MNSSDREQRERLLLNAAEWLALEVVVHPQQCTCGSCYAVANCADIIKAPHAKKVAQSKRRQIAKVQAERFTSGPIYLQ